MSITFVQLCLYAGALFILFIVPGPVWVAVVARTISGGIKAAIPFALGVALGDAIWPLIAMLGVSYLISVYSDIMVIFRYAAVLILCVMGAALIRWPNKVFNSDLKLTSPSILVGLIAGFATVMANPKAILFYMTLLPSFYNFNKITSLDIIVICIISFLVPLLGNISLSIFVGFFRQFLATPNSIRNVNILAGICLILVGIIIAVP